MLRVKRASVFLLAAIVLAACGPVLARPVPVATGAGQPMPVHAEDVAEALAPDDSVPSVEVRTYKGSPYINVLAWAGDDARFGLRSSVRDDGSLARGFHALFLAASLYRQLTLQHGGDWSVFPVGSEQGRVFAISDWFRDVHSCEGTHGCTPFEVVTARLEDALLRRSADTGLEVRIYGRTANVSTVLTLSPTVVTAYLAAFDSVRVPPAMSHGAPVTR